MCVMKKNFQQNHIITSEISKLISSLVKYFTPQDTKTISLQNNRKLMPGI